MKKQKKRIKQVSQARQHYKKKTKIILIIALIVLVLLAFGLSFFNLTGFTIQGQKGQLVADMKFNGDLKNSVNNQIAVGNNIQFTTGQIDKSAELIENSYVNLPLDANGVYTQAISFWINREKQDKKESYTLLSFSSNPKVKQTWSDYSIIVNEDTDLRKIYIAERFSKANDDYQCNYFINTLASDRNKISDGGWHQIVISFTGKGYADRVLYFDGTAVKCQLTRSKQITGANLLFSANNMRLGVQQDNPTAIRFKGLIDELKIWKAPLPAADVLDLYIQESSPVIEQGKEACFVEFEISEEKLQDTNWCNGADFNHDGKVDAADTAIWTTNKNKKGNQEQGDANKDGNVNNADLTILRANLNKKDCDKPKIKFTLANTKNLYGIYSGFVNQFNKEIPEDYIVAVYNNLGKLAGTYSASSSRFIFWDNFEDAENPGGIIEENSGKMSVVVPYSSSMKELRVNYGNTLSILTIPANTVKCQRTCKIENEIVNLETQQCCIGYIAAQQDNGDYYCVKCGDGKQSKYESYYSCYEDFTGSSGSTSPIASVTPTPTTPSIPTTPTTPSTPSTPTQSQCTSLWTECPLKNNRPAYACDNRICKYVEGDCIIGHLEYCPQKDKQVANGCTNNVCQYSAVGACSKNSDCAAQTGMTARCLGTATGNKCTYYKGTCYPGMVCSTVSGKSGTCENLIPGSTILTGNYQCTYGTCTTNSNCVSGTKCSSQKCIKI